MNLTVSVNSMVSDFNTHRELGPKIDRNLQSCSDGDQSPSKNETSSHRKNNSAALYQGFDDNSIELPHISPIMDIPLEMLALIFSFAPGDAGSLRLVHSTFNSETKNPGFLNAYHSNCLDFLKRRFRETGLSEERFESFVKIVLHRLKVAGKKTTNVNRLRELIEFQKERLPSQLFTEGSSPVTPEEFVEREWVIKQHNISVIARKLFIKVSSKNIPYENPENKIQLERNYEYILNHSEKFKSIVVVDLEDLGITEFPEEIASYFTNARILKISNNRLSFLSKKSLSALPNLHALWLHSNHLAMLERGAFSGLTGLLRLRLDGNQLTAPVNDTFLGLTRLQKLWLNNNHLTALVKDIFSELTCLKQLRLNDNQLNTLDIDTLSVLTRLEMLRLDGNPLTKVDHSTFSGLTNLQTLWLDDNHQA